MVRYMRGCVNFAPVVESSTIRLLFALAFLFNMHRLELHISKGNS